MQIDQIFVVTGSNGWLSKNYIQYIYQKGIGKVISIPDSDSWEKVNNELQDRYEKKILLHNSFLSPNKYKHLKVSEYESLLNKNLDQILKLISNNKIDATVFPTTGRVNYLKNQSDHYKLYAYYKLKEEEEFIKNYKKNKSLLIIPKIYSLIGPSKFFNYSSNFNDILIQALNSKQINLSSKQNNLHSISIMDNMIKLIFSMIEKDNSKLIRKFDVVDRVLSILDFANLLSKILGFDENRIFHNFSKHYISNDYLGSDKGYLKLKKQFNNSYYSLEDYIDYLTTT